jgi:hypothetical protein
MAHAPSLFRMDVRYNATFGGLPALPGAYSVPVAAPFVLYILLQDDLPSEEFDAVDGA